MSVGEQELRALSKRLDHNYGLIGASETVAAAAEEIVWLQQRNAELLTICEAVAAGLRGASAVAEDEWSAEHPYLLVIRQAATDLEAAIARAERKKS